MNVEIDSGRLAPRGERNKDEDGRNKMVLLRAVRPFVFIHKPKGDNGKHEKAHIKKEKRDIYI